LRLRGVSFNWKDPSQHGNAVGTQRGFLAQEYEKVFPEWVITGPDGYKSIGTAGLHAFEVESIRVLKTKLDALQVENEALKLQAEETKNKQQAEIDELKVAFARMKNGTDPISGGPGFGTGTLALFGLGLAGSMGLVMKRMGLSLAMAVGLLLTGRKRNDEKKS
jgi:hypothetical protein